MTDGDELRDRLISAPTVAARFLLLEKFLLRQLQQSRALSPSVADLSYR